MFFGFFENKKRLKSINSSIKNLANNQFLLGFENENAMLCFFIINKKEKIIFKKFKDNLIINKDDCKYPFKEKDLTSYELDLFYKNDIAMDFDYIVEFFYNGIMKMRYEYSISLEEIRLMLKEVTLYMKSNKC